MTRRAKIWLAIAVLFSIINLGAAGYAAYLHEGPHAGIHVALAILGAFLGWLLLARPRPAAAGAPLDDARLENLQQSIDAIALEVERIGEAQRFSARLQAERVEPQR
jgi:Na+/melibiose symporter-like transporter